MVAAAKAAVPTVGDQAAALQLGNFAKATASALAELRAASTKVTSHLQSNKARLGLSKEDPLIFPGGWGA